MNIRITKTIAFLSSCLSVVEIDKQLPDHFYISYCDISNVDRLGLSTDKKNNKPKIMYSLYCLTEIDMYNFLKTNKICDSKIIATFKYNCLDLVDIVFTTPVKLKPHLSTYSFFRETIIFDCLIEKIERKQKLERLLNI